MGVVHMLVVALVGITYGWQSDDNGGVEYIVQISPSELNEVQRLGEITSSIDPAVAGHVSRIRIQVGTGALPRETPANLSARNSKPSRAGIETASDRMAVPIPEMREFELAAPIRSPDDQNLAHVAGQSGHTKAAVMKPDPDNTGPIGFQFPSAVGNGAQNTADAARSDLDRAGREIAGSSQNMMRNLGNTAADTIRNPLGAPNGTARVAAPGTRQPDPRRQPTLPQFTGGRSTTTTPGGPSTEPTRPRDQSWSDFARPRAGGPSTESVGSDRTRLGNPQLNNPRLNEPVQNDPRAGNQQNSLGLNTANNLGGSSNRSSNGTFGQTPGGMTFPPRNTASTDPRMTIDRSSQRNNGANSFARDPVTSQQQQMELDRQNRNRASREFAAGPTLANPSAESFTRNAIRASDRDADDRRIDNQPNLRAETGIDARQAPDRRLTNVELAAGAWSIDRYGRLLDRSGRLVPPVAPNDLAGGSRTNLNERYGNRDSRATLEQPMTGRTNPNLVQDTRTYQPNDLRAAREHPYQQPSIRQPTNTPAEFARNGADRMRIAPQSNPRQDPVRDPVSLTKREATPTGSSTSMPISKTAKNHIAAQPLFNGLLLMSFVANIYLMFWLKNLRVRFRDLVAAKRLTGTANPAS